MTRFLGATLLLVAWQAWTKTTRPGRRVLLPGHWAYALGLRNLSAAHSTLGTTPGDR